MARKLIEAVYIDGQLFRPGDDVPAELAEKATNPSLWEGEADKAEQSQSGGDDSWDKLTVEQLQEEINLRNTRRSDESKHIKPESTKKADLVAALEADDKAAA